MKLVWEMTEDDNGNTIWYADSPYTEGENGKHFKWCIEQELRNNRIWYCERHADELGGNVAEWRSLGEAKRSVKEQHETILKQLVALP